METQDVNGNAGEKENQENMGIPERKRVQLKEYLDAEQESLPSDGPISQSESTTAPGLDSNLERDDPADLRQDSNPV